jgi:hypothetical protein
VRLPEKCFEWQAGAWKLGVILCPGIWRISIWWDRPGERRDNDRMAA